MQKPIPIVDLTHQLNLIQPDINALIADIAKSGHFIEGPIVSSFESQFAQAHQSEHCIALNSGTSALHTILKSLQISPGDQIILPANTCFPTAEAICMTGAECVFVDCEEQYYNIDPDLIESTLTENTKAIIAVHLYGQPAQLDKIKDMANKHDLHLIEDCAQAHLASFDVTMVGNFGTAGAFSFYPTKNLGACGEGGAVVTNNSDLAKHIRAFKNHGATTKNIHQFIGHNYRMDSLQAAILSVKLKYLEKWTHQRRQNARTYYECLSGVGNLVLPGQHPKANHVFHQFVIRTPKRDDLQVHLKAKGIETAIHYPTPCHLQPALKHLGYSRGSFPVSEKLAGEILSLPVAEHLSQKDLHSISDCIISFF